MKEKDSVDQINCRFEIGMLFVIIFGSVLLFVFGQFVALYATALRICMSKSVCEGEGKRN